MRILTRVVHQFAYQMSRKLSVSSFFERIGFPLKSVRWSWGAQAGRIILLRAWRDDISPNGRYIAVLKGWRKSHGLKERVAHLGEIEQGGAAAYVLLATAVESSGGARRIGDYRDDAVFAVKKLKRCDNGQIFAELGESVPLKQLRRHARSFVTMSSRGLKNNAIMQARVERFAQVAIRSDQRKFRARVFQACGGRCVISQCDIPEALDAAHIHGRHWRDGYNSHADGLLLRKDLHALYDAKLLKFGPDGRVRLSPDTGGHYAPFKSVRLNASAYCFVTVVPDGGEE